MKKFIYASYLKIKQEEFFELVAEEMNKAYNNTRVNSITDRNPYLQFWIKINPNIIPDSYITKLKKELIEEYGWRIVSVEKQITENKIYIKTEA